mgnify:CR=1 FL=1|tara:strand:- start:2671 stop:2901 length:231 start_codon:yes stop_codon:yes gene_type:complete
MSNNAKKVYELIDSDPSKKNDLFKIALQNPQGALEEICRFAETVNLPVSKNEVLDYLSSIDDDETKLWILKARGGL